MQIINPSYQIYSFPDDILGIFEAIETAGRNCYKSEGTIKYDDNGRSLTAKDFVDKLVKRGHGAMLEHGTVYLQFPITDSKQIQKYVDNPYSAVKYAIDKAYITTNYRVIVENGWEEDINTNYSGFTFNHNPRYMVKLVCDRGVSHEAVRQRRFSYAQSSTGYCNYAKSKFNSEVTFILPPWFSEREERQYTEEEIVAMMEKESVSKTEDRQFTLFLGSCLSSEKLYMSAINNGASPQQARQLLNHAVMTELIMTGFVQDWQHFFNLRSIGTTGAPHPSIEQLATPLYEEFKTRLYL